MTERRGPGRPKTTGTSPKRPLRAPDEDWNPFVASAGTDDNGRSKAPDLMRRFMRWYAWLEPEAREAWLADTGKLADGRCATAAKEAA